MKCSCHEDEYKFSWLQIVRQKKMILARLQETFVGIPTVYPSPLNVGLLALNEGEGQRTSWTLFQSSDATNYV